MVQPLTRGRRALILGVCCSSLFVVTLDSTVLQIALPSLQRDLGASLAGLQWTIDAYVLVLASLLLLAGASADRWGRRRVFSAGLVVFTAASTGCALAPTLEILIATRVLQAVGAAMLNPVALSILTNTFTDRRDRARAIGVWGSVVGLSMVAGPVLGGFLIDASGWRSVFLINLPVGLAALVLTRVVVPESRAIRPRRADPIGQVLVVLVMAVLTFTIIDAPSVGWTSPQTLAGAATAALLLAVLIPFELRRADPLIEMRLFRSRPFTGAAINAFVSFSTLGGFLLLNSLYLQNVEHLDALRAGLRLLPMAGAVLIAAILSGRLVGARGPRPALTIAGVALIGAGMGYAALLSSHPLLATVIGGVLFGIGFGFVNAPITTTAVAGLPAEQAGVAASLASTFRQTGSAIGIAVYGAVLASGLASRSYETAFVSASLPVWWLLAGCGAVVLIVGLVSSRPVLTRLRPRLPAP